MDERAQRLEVQNLHGKRGSICGGHKREGGSSYPGRSDGGSLTRRQEASRGATEPSEISRGHSRPTRRGRRPEHGAGVDARTSMMKQTLDSMAEMPESAAGSSRRNRRGNASGASNVTAGRGNDDPGDPITARHGSVNRRIRNRTYGGVGGGGGDPASYPIAGHGADSDLLPTGFAAKDDVAALRRGALTGGSCAG